VMNHLWQSSLFAAVAGLLAPIEAKSGANALLALACGFREIPHPILPAD